MLNGSELGALGAAAFVAGGANSLAGGGSLLTFPILVALGLPPLTANVTNTLGHSPGYLSIVVGLRDGLAGQRRRIARALPIAVVGALIGALALTACSPGAFAAVAPVLVIVSCILLALAARGGAERRARRRRGSRAVVASGILLGCAYASFFGAGAGFVVLAALSLADAGAIKPLNALSRLLICVANAVALPVLLALNPVDIGAAAVMWPATLIGGYAGARASLRLPDRALRAVVITLGLVAAAYLALR